ncbi:MAG: TniQ family protein, partial [Advenella sp.]
MLMQDSIKDDESGNGFALRMATANELMFCDLTRTFASIGHRYLPASAAKKIAYMFGADPNEVIRSMPLTFKRNGNLVTSLMGHEFQRTFLVRLARPQICIQCLKKMQRTLVLWDLSLVTACPLHRIKLTDICPNCSKYLR